MPGSLLPQQGIDPAAVQQYYASHPGLAPWLARLSLFNVFAAPWFAAIYLLLFLSLAGCVVPRAYRLARSARALPPPAPRNVARMPQSVRHQTGQDAAAALAAATAVLKARKFRLRTGDGWVSAEKGYRRELGNLLFHLALLGAARRGRAGRDVRLQGEPAAGVRHVVRQHGDRAGRVPPGAAGVLGRPAAVHHHAEPVRGRYVRSGQLRGQPSSFNAYLSYSAQPGAANQRYDLRVNHPLNVDGVKVYLIGHGYAPVFKVTDGTGKVVFDQPVPFIAVNTSGLTSEGVIKVPDAQPDQLGFAGVFLPTAVDAGGTLESVFPAAAQPRG